MTVESGVLGFGRRMAEARMTDTVRIKRSSGTPTPDPVTGDLVYTYTTVYEGKCRLVLRSSVVADEDAQSQLVGVQQPRLDVPVSGTGDVRNDDLFEILSSVGDPQLVGREGVVAGMFPHSGSTARRLPVEVAS
jgi:hypothetical protein